MTPEYEKLREAVARAMNDAALKARTENPDIPDEEYDAAQADAALAVVREALREPTQEMVISATHRPYEKNGDLYHSVWRAMFDASALGGPRDE